MVIKRFACCFVVLAGLLQFNTATAISLGFQPSSSTVDLNGSFSVDVVVSGLSSANEIVSAFDLDVLYDQSLLTATGVTFGDELGAIKSEDPFDIFADALIASDLTPGRVDFSELSYLLDDDLDSLQDDDVLLATLSFDAIGIGVSSLIFDAIAFPGIDVKGKDVQRQRH